jgi:hypothetical protein
MDLKSMQCEFESLLGHHKSQFDIVSLYIVVAGQGEIKHRIADIQVEAADNMLRTMTETNIPFTMEDSITIKELGVQWHALSIPADYKLHMRMPAGSDAVFTFEQCLVRLEDG